MASQRVACPCASGLARCREPSWAEMWVRQRCLLRAKGWENVQGFTWIPTGERHRVDGQKPPRSHPQPHLQEGMALSGLRAAPPGAPGIAGLWRSSVAPSPPLPPCSDQARCCAQEPSTGLAPTASPGQSHQHPQAGARLKPRALVKLAAKTQDKLSQSPVFIFSSCLYWKRA